MTSGDVAIGSYFLIFILAKIQVLVIFRDENVRMLRLSVQEISLQILWFYDTLLLKFDENVIFCSWVSIHLRLVLFAVFWQFLNKIQILLWFKFIDKSLLM